MKTGDDEFVSMLPLQVLCVKDASLNRLCLSVFYLKVQALELTILLWP